MEHDKDTAFNELEGDWYFGPLPDESCVLQPDSIVNPIGIWGGEWRIEVNETARVVRLIFVQGAIRIGYDLVNANTGWIELSDWAGFEIRAYDRKKQNGYGVPRETIWSVEELNGIGLVGLVESDCDDHLGEECIFCTFAINHPLYTNVHLKLFYDDITADFLSTKANRVYFATKVACEFDQDCSKIRAEQNPASRIFKLHRSELRCINRSPDEIEWRLDKSRLVLYWKWCLVANRDVMKLADLELVIHSWNSFQKFKECRGFLGTRSLAKLGVQQQMDQTYTNFRCVKICRNFVELREHSPDFMDGQQVTRMLGCDWEAVVSGYQVAQWLRLPTTKHC